MWITVALRSEQFFDERPYPVDLEAVEARDGVDGALRFLRTAFPLRPARIVDLGCGHGRHSGPLRRSGYDVTGVDISERCLRIARTRFPELPVVGADITALPFRDGSFDGAFSIYSSIGVHRPNARVALSEAFRVCRRGATLVVDVANEPVRLSLSTEAVPGGQALVGRWRGARSVEQLGLVISRQGIGVHRLRYERLSRSLPLLLQQSGWRPVSLWGDFDRRPFSRNAPRLLVEAVRE
jgi:SAM-dependent methyltransferase